MTNIKNQILYNKNFRQNKIHYDFKYNFDVKKWFED